MNSPEPSERRDHRPRRRLWAFLAGMLLLGVLLVVVTVPYVLDLDHQITRQFEGKKWELPARVYARPLELFVGKPTSPKALEDELRMLNYIRTANPVRPGEFSVQGGRFVVHVRGFRFPDEDQAAQQLQIEVANKAVTAITNLSGEADVSLVRLDPMHIANVYPKHNEDRVLVKLPEVPPLLIDALLAMEDRNFYDHRGVHLKSIFRAFWANLRAGRTVQGGSTLTQQLVKNYFLSNERTVRRKLNEAIMSLLLEWHYPKDEILEVYLNEVYLGQDGQRAIHGFGLASQFYFQRRLNELEPEQLTLLVAMVKGAIYYSPRRHPERTLTRRNLVIDALAQGGLLAAADAETLKARPLGVTEAPPSGVTSYPGFLELVRRQLKRDYRDEDLRSEGLRIFTTLDPLIQEQAERAVVEQLEKLEKEKRMKRESLQGAMVVASVEQGEIKAVVAARDVRYAGFNRITDMRRPIGSLVKPAVYLTALARPDQFSLVSLLDDSELVIPQAVGEPWAPKNYDKNVHGVVPMLKALAHSYNIATVRLGLQVGVGNVIEMMRSLGIDGELNPFPSLFLGSAELPPIEVLQMYQTIAAGGYRSPLRAILAVVNQADETLQRYPLQVEQAVSADADFLLTYALREVATSGTAQTLPKLLPAGMTVAGKTGTTDDLRDSWFAGFNAEHVGVAWVGRDDNQPIGMTGAAGAMRLWAGLWREMQTTPLQLTEPDGIEWAKADPGHGVFLGAGCDYGATLPASVRTLATDRRRDCSAFSTERAETVSTPTEGFLGF